MVAPLGAGWFGFEWSIYLNDACSKSCILSTITSVWVMLGGLVLCR